MTDAERDELLSRLDERTEEIKNKLKTDYMHLHGNGRPGLLERVQKLEDREAARARHYGAIAGVIGFIINAAIAVYAIAKKIK
jgi:hypothetical protein